MTPLAELVGESPGIAAVRQTIERLLRRQAESGRLPPILILGETGTGKGLVARLLHRAGPRAGGPFVDVNCAAIPETLLEAELFGYERGAFTDARQAKAGLFQTAHRGTLFLDEVGLVPEAVQAKLLKALEDRAVRRLGATRSEPVDVWILTATGEDLVAATRARRFREDLYHRLAVLTLHLPPLRERGGDVLALAERFLARVCADYGLPPKTLLDDAREALLRYAWPGNVRELGNVIERVALLADESAVAAAVLGLPGPVAGPSPDPRPAGAGAPVDEAVAAVERAHLLRALEEANWNVSRAAARLGLPRGTLRYRMEVHQLRRGATAGPSPAADRGPAGGRAPDRAPAEASAEGPVRWEPRRVTFLRAALLAASAESAPFETSRALEAMVEKIRTFGGRIEELGASGMIAVFGLEPVEDAPRRAAHAATAIGRLADRARASDPARPRVKLAIHTAQVPVGRLGEQVAIDADAKHRMWGVLEALLAGAELDTTVASPATATLLERRFELSPVSALEPVADVVYRLERPERSGLAPGRRMAPFVGRRQELELLENRLASAVRGRGQVVGVAGEAGIGKSRLLYEFRQALADHRVAYLEGRCVSYGTNIPFLPVVDLSRMGCRVIEADTPEAIVAKVRRGLELVGMAPEDAAPYFLHLLGVKEGTERLRDLTPEAIRVRTFEVLRETTFRSSRRRPLVLAVEDLHWIDSASEAYFASLIDGLVGAPILLVVTYRPGYRPAWLDRSYATQIALPPLAADESRQILRALFAGRPLPATVAERLVAKAEGNPFFLEELGRAVGASEDPRLASVVPDTIQEVLLARIDRLPPDAKRLLQAAAVLGREAAVALLGAIWDGPGPVAPLLRELGRAEFTYEPSGSGEPVYAFTHALAQEVAYESLSPERRRALHAAAGAALERQYAGRLDEVADRLAHHFARTDEPAKAVEYLARSADKAARSYAHAEAVTALDEALRHVERLPSERRDRLRLRLLLRQARSLSFLGRFTDALQRLRREASLAERLGAPDLTGRFHFWMAHTYSHLGDGAQALAHAERALAAAEQAGDEETIGQAHFVLAQESSWSGQPRHSLEHGRRAIEFLERAGARWWVGLAHWIVAVDHIAVGELDAALDAARRALAVGEAIGDPRITSYATWSIGWVHALRGDADAAIEACRRGLAGAPDPVNAAVAAGHLGYAHLERGDVDEAVSLLERAAADIGRFGFRRLHGRFVTFLGEAYLAQGKLERAETAVRDGLATSQETGYLYGAGWAELALGRIAVAASRLADAKTHLEAALEVFGRIGARFMEGRCQLTLGELARARGDGTAAADHLAAARRVFLSVNAPRHAARAEALARLG